MAKQTMPTITPEQADVLASCYRYLLTLAAKRRNEAADRDTAGEQVRPATSGNPVKSGDAQ